MAFFEDLALLSRRDRARLAVLVIALVAVVFWITTQLLQPGAPRRVVLASGSANGVYHRHAQRYVQLLAHEGVIVQERLTEGAAENLSLLLDPKSGVDVAFLQGGLAKPPQTDDVMMLASLYYEPLWIFYRDPNTLAELRLLHGKRIDVGAPGSGTRVLALQMLELNGVVDGNGVGRDNTDIVAASGPDAVRALRAGEIDAALFVGGADTPAIQQALRDPVIKLMSLARADAYPRRFPFISKLSLPAGTIDFALGVPDQNVDMIGTRAMLAARDRDRCRSKAGCRTWIASRMRSRRSTRPRASQARRIRCASTSIWSDGRSPRRPRRSSPRRRNHSIAATASHGARYAPRAGQARATALACPLTFTARVARLVTIAVGSRK